MDAIGKGNTGQTLMITPSYSEKIWWQAAFLLIAAIPVTLAAYYFDPRLHNDIPIWVKSLKFELSLAVHLITLALVISRAPAKLQARYWLFGIAILSALASIAEIGMIGSQAARGLGSHFNNATAYDAMIYKAMGVGAITLTLPALLIGARFLMLPTSARLTPGLKLGIGLGLTLGFLLTFFIAGYMSLQADGHWVNAPQTDTGGMTVTGWSRRGGDLRVPHFLATHIMQILPLVGWLADIKFGASSKWPKRIVIATAIFCVSATGLLFAQALSGRPLY